MNAGIPGDISRKEGSIVEVAEYDATNPPAAFGVPLVLDGTSHNVRHILASDQLPTSIYGFLVRPFPLSNANTSDGLGTSTPNTNQLADVMKKGYLSVLLQNTTAAVKGGQVYVRAAATSGSLLQGGLEAAASATATATAHSGNTGNATIGTVTPGVNAQGGTYNVNVKENIDTTDTTKLMIYSLSDANGNLVDTQYGDGVSTHTVVFANQQLGFTLTQGSTPNITGDSYQIAVTLVNLPIPNCTFMGAADSNGNTEIALKM
jgi:hypothetical protein